jgi:hypothetical protein
MKLDESEDDLIFLNLWGSSCGGVFLEDPFSAVEIWV